MFCEKCGNEIGENENFCQKCGWSVNPANKDDRTPNLDTDIVSTQPVPIKENEKKEKKPINKKYLLFGGIAIAVILLLIIIISSLSGTVNPQKYFIDDSNVKYSGYNEFGKINVNDLFDIRSLLLDLGGGEENLIATVNKSVSGQIDKKYGSVMSSLFDGLSINSIINEFEKEGISIEADKTENLKNGDEITVTVKIDSEYFKKYDFKKSLKDVDSVSKTYTVSGLNQATIIDPFDFIESVIYDEKEKKSYIRYKKNYLNETEAFSVAAYENSRLRIKGKDGQTIGTIGFSSDKGSYESTKKITVKLSSGLSVDSFSSKGFMLSAVEKDFTPLTLDYLKDASRLKSADYTTLKSIADEDTKSNSPVFQKAYLCTDSSTASNKIVFIYSYKSNDKTLFLNCYFDGVKICSDGNLFTEQLYDHINYSGYDSMQKILDNLKTNWSSIVEIS